MLVLSRLAGERIRIGDDIWITITEIRGKAVRIGIDAPENIQILRDELIPAEDSRPTPRHASIAHSRT